MLLRLLALLACAVALCHAQAVDSLRKLTALTKEEWKTVQGGGVVAKLLETADKRELAVAGVARVHVSKECLLNRFRDMEAFKKGPLVRQISRFTTLIDSSDLAGLTLDAADTDAVRECRIGSCRIKLPVSVMRRLAEQQGTPGEDYVARVSSFLRDELWTYVRSYLSLGDDALMEYHDKEKAVLMSKEFGSLVNGWPELNALAPELYDAITRGPQQSTPFLEEFLYWSKESFGLKPVISITHVTIQDLKHQAWIASKQIYASHYFDTSLAVTLVADDPTDPTGNTIYLAYVNRSRIDLLSGAFGGLARSMVRGRLQEGMKKNLHQTVIRLETSPEPPDQRVP